MTEEQALLCAVRDAPTDDTPRLVYADWLDENQRADQAEFIRCQIELVRFAKFDPAHRKEFNEAARERLAKQATRLERGESESFKLARAVEQGGKDYKARHEALRRRERELWVAHNAEWFPKGPVEAYRLAGDTSQNRYGTVVGEVSRGFVGAVEVPTVAAWLGGECECVRRWELDRTPVVIPGGCFDCSGAGRTPGIGAEVVRRWPVTRVVVARKESWQFASYGWVWMTPTIAHPERPGLRWHNDGCDGDEAHALPEDVYSALPGETIRWEGNPFSGFCKAYPTRAAALAALSAALIRLAAKCPACDGKGFCPKCSGEGCSDYGVTYNGPCVGSSCAACRGTGDVRKVRVH